MRLHRTSVAWASPAPTRPRAHLSTDARCTVTRKRGGHRGHNTRRISRKGSPICSGIIHSSNTLGRTAAIYSLIGPARLESPDPEPYLRQEFERVADYLVIPSVETS